MRILTTTIHIGLQKPTGFLHMTDSHLPAAVDSAQRNRMENTLAECLQYAAENGLTPVHTGDMFTYLNDENLRVFDRLFAGRDFIFAIGNHDFCPEGGDGDDAGNVHQAIPVLAQHFRQDLFFHSRMIGELNVVTLQNGFFRIDAEQLSRLRREDARGIPILLCMHVPVFTPEHARERMKFGNCAHLLGADASFISQYPERYHFQRPDAVTLEAIRYIQNEPCIKAILAGHTHMNYEEILPGGVRQIVTGSLMDGHIREIRID